MKNVERSNNGIKIIALSTAITFIGSYAIYKNINSKHKTPIVVVDPSDVEGSDDESTGDPNGSKVLTPVEPTTPEPNTPGEPSEQEKPVTSNPNPSEPSTPSEPTPPVVPNEPQTPEKPIIPDLVETWDLFNPTNDDEKKPIIDEIIYQLKADDPVAYRNPAPHIINDILCLINGVKMDEPDHVPQSRAILEGMIDTATSYEIISEFVEDGEVSKGRMTLSIEKMMANSQSRDYLSRYIESKQPIYDAVFQSKNIKALLSELAKFTDEYYDVFNNKEMFLGEAYFKDLPVEVQFYILQDFIGINGHINNARYCGVLPVDFQQRYDFRTKLDMASKLLKPTTEKLEKRSLDAISLSNKKTLTTTAIEVTDVRAEQYIKLTATKYVKMISFNNIKA